MSGKHDDDRDDGKNSKYDDGDDDIVEEKGGDTIDPPKIEVLGIEFEPAGGPLSGPLELKIKFELDRDVIAGHWIVRFLVDSCDRRLIRVLGETAVDDYAEGDNEVYFSTDRIDITGIAPSTLTNSGLLMAVLVAEGEEVASINMVVNVKKNSDDEIIREILNPLS